MAWWSAIPAGKALWKSGKWVVKKAKKHKKGISETGVGTVLGGGAIAHHKHVTNQLKGEEAQEQTLHSRHDIPEAKVSNYTKMQMKKIKKRMKKEGKL